MDKRLVEIDGVRRFGVDSYQKHVDNVLASVPKDKRGVVLDVDLGPDGVRAVVAARLDDHWSISLIGEKSSRDWGLGTRVVYAW